MRSFKNDKKRILKLTDAAGRIQYSPQYRRFFIWFDIYNSNERWNDNHVRCTTFDAAVAMTNRWVKFREDDIQFAASYKVSVAQTKVVKKEIVR